MHASDIPRLLTLQTRAREIGDRGLEREAKFQLDRLGYVEPSVEGGSMPEAEAPKRRGRPPKETTVAAPSLERTAED